MAIKLIDQYQAIWDSSANQGFFMFTYFDGERKRTPKLSAENFAVVTDLLRNERPVYGDHTKAMVMTQAEEVGEGEAQ